MQEAMLWHKERNGVRCDLCNRKCFIAKDKLGFCLVRKNKDNKLYTLNYGKLIAVNIDPIEKKPLFHFYPGSSSLSIASAGCNFRCQFCFEPRTRVLTSEGTLDFETLFNKGKICETEGGSVSFLNGCTTLTHTNKISKITKVYRHYYSGEMVVIKPYHLPKLKTTASHEFFVYDKGDKEIKKISAKDITKKHLLLVPKLFLKNKDSIVIDAKEILSNYKTEYRKKTKIDEEKAKEILNFHYSGKTSREISKIFGLHPTYVRKLIGKLKKEGISKGLLYEKNAVVEKEEWIKFKTEKSFIRRYIQLDENFAALLGYYCAEGHVTKYKGRASSHHLVFSFGKHEENNVEKTAKLMKEIFGIKPKIIKRRTTITVEVGKSSIALLFKILCGDKSNNKNVPKIILECENRKIIHSFLKAYFEGDGYKRNNVLEFATSSQNFAYNTFFLLLKLGLLPSFYEFSPSMNVIEDRAVKFSSSFRIKIYGEEVINSFLNGFSIEKIPKNRGCKFTENGNYYLVPIRDIRKENYSGFVFNLEVEDEDHSFPSNFAFVGNCCNAELSQALVVGKTGEVPGEEYTPEEIVKMAEQKNCKSISYTYTEPTIFFEFAYKTAKLAHRSNIFNTFVTNGYMTEEAVKKIAKYLDAATVDFKASGDPEFYKKFMNVPSVSPIFDTLKQMKKQRVFIEITNLIVPQIGDSLEQSKKLAQWITSELDSNIPFHLIQFFPSYQLMELPPTPVATLERHMDEARKAGLRYIYIGNVPGHEAENTYCHNCRELLIQRHGMRVKKINLSKDRCPNCGLRLNVLID